MIKFSPKEIFYEDASLSYPLGKFLQNKYNNVPWTKIDNHNNIPFFREKSNSEFPKMKQNLIVGVRKTHKYMPNNKISDYLVPYTSSGCTASCLYCYLVCNYNKCSYLRLFVNREDMLDRLIKTSQKSTKELIFEIGSNSDLILENTITKNLEWTIENFAKYGRGQLTLPTKFDMVDPLINLNHKGKTIIRMSLNPEEIIKKVELGTSSLYKRIEAINKLSDADYPIGILLAPIILVDNFESIYSEFITKLKNSLSKKVIDTMSIEIIFMTYSYIHRKINEEAFKNVPDLYNKNIMTSRGLGKYRYKSDIRNYATKFIKEEILKNFKNANIIYIS